MKINNWIIFGFAALLSAQPLIAEAVEFNHTAISDKVIKQTARKFGTDAAKRIVVWSELVEKNKDKPVAEKLELTNRFINSIPLKSEEEIWGHSHWSTPFEMIARNSGSHADHAIGKYVTLEALGIGIDKMHIVHAHSAATPSNSYMVLVYYPTPAAMPLVLDSVNGEIKPANERNDLVPEHSFNDDGMWLPKVQADGANDANIEASAHIELWREMNYRMDSEILPVENPSAIKY